MPATEIKQRRSTLARIAGSAVAGVAFAVTVFASGTAAAAGSSDVTRVGPERGEMIFIDPFRTFTNCLAAAAHSDSMYPGTDPDEVNNCLEDNGVL